MTSKKTIIEYFLFLFLFSNLTSAVIKEIKECSDILYDPNKQSIIRHVFLICYLSKNTEKCCHKINTDTDLKKNNILSGCLCHEEFIQDMYYNVDNNELAQELEFSSINLKEIFTTCGTFDYNKKHCPSHFEDHKYKHDDDEDCIEHEESINGVKVKIGTKDIKILNKHLDDLKKDNEEKLTYYAKEIKEPFSNFYNDKIAFNRKNRYYGQQYNSKYNDQKRKKSVLLSDVKNKHEKIKVDTLPMRYKYDNDNYMKPYAKMGRVGYFYKPKQVKAILSSEYYEHSKKH